jgi:hypothetical protein
VNDLGRRYEPLAVPIVQVVGTVGGLFLVWWKVTQIREVNAYELLRDARPKQKREAKSRPCGCSPGKIKGVG